MELNTPIFKISNNDVFTLDDCTCGTLIMGATGSGKTSGPGELIARAFLRKGFGGLVLTAKVGETRRWIEYAKKEGREKDLVIFSPSSKKKLEFNPLLYELLSKKGGKEVENLVSMFTIVMQMNGRANMQSQGSSQDPFWEWAKERLLRAVFHLLILSGFDLTMVNIINVIRDIPIEYDPDPKQPTTLEAFNHLIKASDPEGIFMLEEMGKKSFTIHCLTWDYHNIKTPADERVFDVIKTYFLLEFSRLGSKTRSGITEQLYGFIDPFRAGAIAEYFTEGISDELLPEATYQDGKIIILDFPIKEWMNVGIIAQGLYKWSWMKAIEKRDTSLHPKPVMLWQDEYQLFSARYDGSFQSTARESRACNVIITQNLPNLYAMTGGSNARDYVHSLLGNMNTKIVCGNDNAETNNFMAGIIGQTFQTKDTYNFGSGHSGGSFSQQRLYQVEPVEFTMFRRGGPQNDFKVDAVITSTGKKFSTGKNYMRAVFTQNP